MTELDETAALDDAEHEELIEQFDRALKTLASYEHRMHSVLNSAIFSRDVYKMARALEEVTATAEPGRNVQDFERVWVTEAARAAGELLRGIADADPS